jgi:ribonuclease J
LRRIWQPSVNKKIEVITEKDHFVHVSGHPNQDELKEMYELARPKIAIPVHGEFVHMKQHAAIFSQSVSMQMIIFKFQLKQNTNVNS